MPDRARVANLEAVEAFRARMIIYRERAGRVLDEIGDEVLRTRLWLQGECRAQWEREIHRRKLALEQAQQELFNARTAVFNQSVIMQQAAVKKAQHALREAEERSQRVKHWDRQFDHQVEPLSRQVEKLRHNVSHDLAEAVAWLNEMSKTLREYSEQTVSAGSRAAPVPNDLPATDGSAPGPEGAGS